MAERSPHERLWSQPLHRALEYVRAALQPAPRSEAPAVTPEEQRFTEAREPDYATQYTDMMGTAPDRLEVDTSDTDLGKGWHEQMAEFDRRMAALLHDQEQEQTQQQGMEY